MGFMLGLEGLWESLALELLKHTSSPAPSMPAQCCARGIQGDEKEPAWVQPKGAWVGLGEATESDGNRVLDSVGLAGHARESEIWLLRRVAWGQGWRAAWGAPERKGSSEEEELKQRCRGEHPWSKWGSPAGEASQEDRKSNVTADVWWKPVCPCFLPLFPHL